MKKNILRNIRVWAIMMACLMVFGVGYAWGTDTNTPTSGTQYRFKARYSGTDYYLVAPTSTGLGTATTTETDGTVFTFTYESSKWYITFTKNATTYWLSGNGTNGNVTISTTKTECTTVTTNSDYCKIGGTKWIQFNYNNGSPRFGCYSSTQTGAKLTTVAVPRTVSWSVNGNSYTTGNPSTSVNSGSKVTTLPTAPGSALCDGSKVFVGWSASAIVGTTNTRPADLFNTVAGAPTVTANVTYYAVFATAGTPAAATLTATYASHTGWTETDCCGSSFWVLCSGASLTSPVIDDLSTVTSITFKARTYGGASYNTVTVKTSNNETVGSASAANTTLTDKTISVSGLTGIGSFVFTGSATTASYGPGMNNITIYYTRTPYSNYATTCVVSHTVSSAVDPTGKATVTLGATSVAEGSTTTASCGSITAGYEFVDWSISGTGASLSSTTANPTTITMGTANVTVTANLRCITPTFSAHPGNVTCSQGASPSLSVTAAAGGASLSYQWMQCATVDGVYSNVASGGTSSSYSPSTASLGTMYYKCKVTNAATGCSTYATSNAASVTVKGTVTYDANGGTGTMTDASSPYASGATVTVKSNSFTAPAGKQFDHWDTNPGDDGTDYAPAATFTMSGNTTLYAQWTCINPSISVQPADATYTKDETPTALSVTASGGTLSYQWKQCATVDGTYVNVASGGTSSTYSPSTGSVGTTYYKCVITNTGSSCNTTVTSDPAEVTISAPSYFPNGATIFIQAESTSAWTGGGCVMAWFHTAGGDEDAQETYWLFDATGGDAGKKLFATVVPEDGNLPYLDIQRFASNCSTWWNKNGGCSYADADESNTIRSTGKHDTDSDGDYIRWNDSGVTLDLYGDPSDDDWASSLASFSDQGAGVWTATYNNYAPADADGESQDFKVKTNYNGWIGNTGSNTNATLDGMHVGSTYNITATLDVTDHSLVMSKTFVKGEVSFDLQGHGSAISKLTNVAAGSKISAPSTPSATGYTFGGWFTDPECTDEWTFASDEVSETMTLYAKWTIDTYTITKTLTNVANSSLPSSFTYTGSATTALNSSFTVDGTNFFLPSSITVTMGGATLTKDTHYTYNNSTGAFTFTAVITGDIEITATATPKLKSIAITTQPTTRKYLVGDLFSSTGAVVTATMGDGNTKAVTASATWTPTSALSAGTSQTVTATYTENGITKTATTTVDVYSVTVSTVNMSGTAISNASVTASCSGRTLSQSVGSTNYLFNSWNVTAGGVTVSTNTITGTPTGNVTINAKFHDPITVTWKVGASAASGSPTTEVKYGTKISSLPSTPADNAVASCGDANKFMGWTAAGKIEGTGHSAPADLFTTVGGATTLTENTTYRAVFATQTTSSPVVYKLTKPSTSWSGYTSSTDTDDKGKTWSYYAAGANQSGTYYYGLNVNALNYNIASPDFGGNITGIKMWVRNGSSTEDRTVYLCSSNETYNPTSGDLGSASIPKSNDSEVTASISGTFSQFYIYVSAALQFKYIEVTVGGSTTTKDYITGCCTNLDDLNGEVSWSDPTTAVVSWDNIAHVDSWTVEYKTGAGSYSTTNVSADEVYTKSKTDDSRKVTMTGLACGTDYTFHIVATPAEDYCNKDQTINDSQLHKYAITLDPANGEVTGGSFIAYSEYECDGEDVKIEAEAATGYEFVGWTITKAGGGEVTPDDASDASSTFEMPAKDVTVVASFDPLTYTITYYDGDDVDDDKTFSGVHASGYPTTHTYASATTLKSATKDGYDFGGWFDNKECDGDEITSLGATAYTADITLYAKWTPEGTHRVTITAPTNGTISVSWNSGANSFTSGYRDIDENTVLTITGTPSAGYDLSSLTVGGSPFTSGNTHTLTGDITVAASFSVHTYSITYKDQGGSDFTGTQAGAPTTHTYGTATTLKMPTRVGYTFGGWFTASNCASGAVGNTTAASLGATDYTADIVLYAKWNPITYTISYEGLSGATNSNPEEYTIETSTITLVDPGTRTGWTFAGWTLGGSPITQIAKGSMGDKTITANWTINQYNVAVDEVAGVTIHVGDLDEGENADVNYGTELTLTKDGLETGIYWVGWKVTNAGGDDVTASVVSENTLTVPAYPVTVTAVLGKMKAWCMPEFEVTGDVHLTSTKDVYVYLTADAGNLLTFSGTNMQNVTKITIDYLDNNGDVVATKSSSPLRLYNSGGSSLAEGPITSGFSTGTYEENFSVRFYPRAYDELDNYKLQLKIYKGTRLLKTVEHPMNGRALPEEFVIAVKSGDQWYALPNNLLSTSSQPSIVPLKISVDNTTTPTAATYAPTKAVYKATGRNTATKYMNGIRFTTTTPSSNWLQTAKGDGTYNMWLSTTNSDSAQVWYLSSSDFGAYTLTMDAKHNSSKKMGIYTGGYMGFHGTPSASDIYFLPITNKYTEIAATVSEWGEHGVIVQPETPSDLALVASASMNVGTADPTAATTTAINAVMGTARRVKVDGGSLTVGAIANEGKLLYIHWKNSGGTEIGISQVTIPTVIAADATMYSIATTKAAWAAKSEVYVLPGVTLTANANSFSGEGALSVPNLHLYPGATLNVSSGTFNATTLRLHNGWSRAGTKAYDVARVYIADDAALTKTTASMDYDIYELADGYHFYPLAVPFPVKIKYGDDYIIDYADSWLAGYSTYGMSGQYVIKEYDGERRAEKGPDQQNNWKVVNDDATLSPGKGYIMAAVPVYGEAIIRIPLTFDNAWTADGELGTVSAVTKNVVSVEAYAKAEGETKNANKGWNLLGVPFMSCYGTSAGMYDEDNVDDPASIIQGKFDFKTGEWKEEDVRYVNVPVHDFSEYIQTDITDAGSVLRPGWCFFVQIATSGNLKFLTADQAASSSLPIYAPRREQTAMPTVETGIILSDGEKSDKTTFLVSDKYSATEYEINADLEKMFGNGYTLATYSLSGATRLAYNALSNADAANIIPIGYRAPADGEYTFSINPRYAESDAFEHINLIDYTTGIVTDLLQYSYTFTTERTQNDTRFALNVVPRQETPTGIENGANGANDANGVRKLLIDGKMYIILNGKMFDATGKKVREINK